jgi:hypothetical protein
MGRSILPVVLVACACLGAGAQDLRQKHVDVSVAAGAALPGVVQASWYEDFDPATTASLATRLSPSPSTWATGTAGATSSRTTASTSCSSREGSG